MKKILIPAGIVFIIAILLILGRKSISTDIIIDAPADQVWAEFIQFDQYPHWNPFIKKLTGEIVKGGTIEVTFQIEGSKPMIFTPKILQLEQNKIFQWEGRLLMPGIFTGRHTFQLEAIEGNRTRLIQKEDFNGILVPFFSFVSTVEGFESMNRALKKRVEKK